jgi:hypothetical protein
MWSVGGRVLYQPSIRSKLALRARLRVGQDFRSSSAVLMMAKNDSARALRSAATPNASAYCDRLS